MSVQLTEHFRLDEFACGTIPVPADLLPNVRALAEQLEVIRERVGGPVHVLSGWRSEEVNRRCGGAKRSQHLLGRAADLQVPGMTPPILHTLILGMIREGALRDGGVGKYDSFVHFDVGPARRWDNSATGKRG